MAQSKQDAEGSGSSMRWFYVALGVVVVAGVAFLVTAGGGEPEPLPPLTQADLDVAPDSGAAVVQGPQDAPVTLLEFADYQCPHCAQFAALPGPAIRRDYVQEGLVQWRFYDFPLSSQTNAVPAALAARCAGEQGRFWEMHDMIYARQTEWAGSGSPRGHFEDYAEQIGVGVDAWGTCYVERQPLDAIMASRRFGEQKGVNGTPTIFVNGERVNDWSYQGLQSVIEAALESAGATADDDAGDAADGG